MAIATITTDLTDIFLFETDAGALVREQSAAIQLEGTQFKEGAGAIGSDDGGVGLNGYVSAAFAALNLSATHIFAWILVLTEPDTTALGGIRIRVEDALGNFGEWFVGGSENYFGGWQMFCVDTTRAFDRSSATAANKAAITRIGPIANLIRTGIDGSAVHMDAARFGTGITVTGGTVADPIDFVAIDVADKAVALQFGIIQKHPAEGVFVQNGRLTIGSNTGTLLTVFKDTVESITVANMPVALDFNKLNIESNATNPTQFTLGTEVGTPPASVGFSIGSLKAQATINARKPQINSIDADTADMDMLGFTLAGGGKLNLTGAFNRVISGLIVDYDSIVPRSDAVVRDCTIAGSNAPATSAALDLGDIEPAVDTLKNLQFIGGINTLLLTPTANRIRNFQNYRFAGQTKKLRINAPLGRLVTINILEGGDAILNPGDLDLVGGIVSANVTIVDAVILKTTFTNNAGTPQQNVNVRYEQSDGTLIDQGSTDVNGVFSVTIDKALLPFVGARIDGRKGIFEDYFTILTIPVTGFDIPVSLAADIDVDRPI